MGQPIQVRATLRAEDAGRRERSIGVAVTLADSLGDAAATAKVLDSAIAADHTALAD